MSLGFGGCCAYLEPSGSIEDDPEDISATPVGALHGEALAGHHGAHVGLDVQAPVAGRAGKICLLNCALSPFRYDYFNKLNLEDVFFTHSL